MLKYDQRSLSHIAILLLDFLTTLQKLQQWWAPHLAWTAPRSWLPLSLLFSFSQLGYSWTACDMPSCSHVTCWRGHRTEWTRDFLDLQNLSSVAYPNKIRKQVLSFFEFIRQCSKYETIKKQYHRRGEKTLSYKTAAPLPESCFHNVCPYVTSLG